MTLDPVVSALTAAIAASDSVDLRVALGNHLLSKGEAAEALVHFEAGMSQAPESIEALRGAQQAAQDSGESVRATAYQLALAALSGAAEPATEVTEEEKEPIELSSVGVGTRVKSTGPNLRVVTEDYIEEDEALITFDDVGGLDDVKKRLHRSFLLPLQQPEVFARYGKQIGGGLLLYGPPGCGKTFIAKAVAGEIGARFMNIGMSDVLDMWLGESERKLHELFETARSRAPVVLFFDEIDALGQRRTHLRQSAGRNVVNQLLTELDGMTSENKDVFVLGATNQPWDLDAAIRRPGRFDRMLFIPPPDQKARETILKLKLADRPLADNLSIGALASQTKGYSGADLQALVNTATEFAIEQAIKLGSDVPIDDTLLASALADMRPSTRPWLETARNYARYANEGGVYDELHDYLKQVGMA